MTTCTSWYHLTHREGGVERTLWRAGQQDPPRLPGRLGSWGLSAPERCTHPNVLCRTSTSCPSRAVSVQHCLPRLTFLRPRPLTLRVALRGLSFLVFKPADPVHTWVSGTREHCPSRLSCRFQFGASTQDWALNPD